MFFKCRTTFNMSAVFLGQCVIIVRDAAVDTRRKHNGQTRPAQVYIKKTYGKAAQWNVKIR